MIPSVKPGGRIGLTARQRDCFEAIEHFVVEHKRPPSRRELAAMLSLKSMGRVVELLRSLQERGWIDWVPRKARTLVIVPDVDPRGYVLPPVLDAALREHCARTGDEPVDVVADAVALFLDEREADMAA